MTVTAATITTVSGGRIAITDDDLAYYSALAVAVLAQDGAASLPTVVYDRAHALMICHFYAGDQQGDLEMKSEDRGGDWKYTKAAGDTTYLVQYRALLARFGIDAGALAPADVPDDGAVRCDAVMEELQLDGNTIPTYTDEEAALL